MNSLWLARNSIQLLGNGPFVGLDQLQTLALNANRITVINRCVATAICGHTCLFEPQIELNLWREGEREREMQ